MLNCQIVSNKLFFTLVFNSCKQIFAKGILSIQVTVFQCLHKIRITGDCVLRCHLQHERHNRIVVVSLILFSCENTAIECFVQATQRVRSDLTDKTTDAVVE